VRVLLFVACAAAVGCGTFTQRPEFAALTSGAAPPSALIHVLQERWPGSQLAAAASCPQGAPAPSFVAGDFNGDGQPDLAVRLEGSGGQRVAVAFSRTDSYDLEQVTTELPSGPVQLNVQPQGARFTHRDNGLADYFPTDTLTLAPCGQTPTGYFWTGAAFDAAPNMLLGAGPTG